MLISVMGALLFVMAPRGAHAHRPDHEATRARTIVFTMTDGRPEATAVAYAVDRAERRKILRAERKWERQHRRATNQARRLARKKIRRAFRLARRQSEAAPSDEELAQIAQTARASVRPQPPTLGTYALDLVGPGEFELHVVVPGDPPGDGTVSVELDRFDPDALLRALMPALGSLLATTVDDRSSARSSTMGSPHAHRTRARARARRHRLEAKQRHYEARRHQFDAR